MKTTTIILLSIVLVVTACNHQKKVSVSSIKFKCKITSNPVDIKQPYFDTLQVFIKRSKPDLISFKETIFSEECKSVIEKKGYQFIPIHFFEADSNIFYTPIVYKSGSFTLLGSSYYLFKNEDLVKDKNLISWFQFKNVETGHIFYLFNLQLQQELTQMQSQVIAYEVLRRIDKVSAGAPVILIGDLFSKNSYLRSILTENWKGIYPLNEVNIADGGISEFLVNDFFNVKNSFAKLSKDSLVNNAVFIFRTQKVKRNKTGKNIPE